jgi:hypothetical protein
VRKKRESEVQINKKITSKEFPISGTRKKNLSIIIRNEYDSY